MNGNTLYVAGSDPSDVSRVCPAANAIPLPCGALTPVDLTALTAGAPVAIAGGYHDRMALGSGNLLFVGSRGCNFTTLQGCLTLFDTVKATATVAPSAVFLPPNPGPGNDDVTGIAPVANNSGLSNQVYVIEAGELVIYDTLTQKVKLLDTPSPNVTGQAVDVVAVDN